MANQQLVDYIKSQLAVGVMKPDLVKAVQAAGWTQTDMDAAFAVAEGRAPAVPPPPAPMQHMPVQPQPVPATIRPPGPIAAQPSVMDSVQPKPRPVLSSNDPGAGKSLHTVRGRFSSSLLYVLIAIVIVVGFVIYLLPILRPLIFGGLAPATSPTTQPTGTASTGVGATIDQSSLMSQSPTPIISGTAQGFDTLAVLVGQNIADGGEVTVQNGVWQFAETQTLAPGTYQVIVSPVDSATGNLPSDMAANKVESSSLVQGSLTIASSTAAASSTQQ